jgi:hypothetical protein
LPWDDPSIELLDATARAEVASYWAARAQAELNVARAFSDLSSGLEETGVVPEVTDMLETSIQNEHDHADICWRLANRYAGSEVPRPAVPAAVDFPRLPSVPAELRPTLHAMGLCCINESIATVWLEHGLKHASSPLIRAATRLHVADEVLHARVGWAHLASPALTTATRKELARWIVPLLQANVDQWLAVGTTEVMAEVPGHGLPPRSEHRGLVLGVVRDVVLPGFARVGLDARQADGWFYRRYIQ